MNRCAVRNCEWSCWPVLIGMTLVAALLAGPVAAQVVATQFSQQMQEGLDNTQFEFQLFQDSTGTEPALITDSGANGGDSVRLGPIQESTFSASAETGLFFDLQGPGTLRLSWKVSSQPIDAGYGAILQYAMFDPGTGTGLVSDFISGDVNWTEVVIDVPDASRRVLISYIRSARSVSQGSDSGWVDNLRWETTGVPEDTTPDPFSFTDQVNVARSATVDSNTIQVSGINAATPISIASCTSSACSYSVNGGAFTALTGTVENGDTVVARQIASSAFSTTTDLVLDLNGVSDTFNVTTLAEPAPEVILEGDTATGSGSARATATLSEGSGPECAITEAAFLNAPAPPPTGVELPHGLLGFTVDGCASGFSVEVTVEYPDAIPADAAYWKLGEDWFTIPATISGNQVSFTIVDNGAGDADPTEGRIVDPGGIGIAAVQPPPTGEPQAIPTLSARSLVLLAAVIGLLAVFGLRRRYVG